MKKKARKPLTMDEIVFEQMARATRREIMLERRDRLQNALDRGDYNLVLNDQVRRVRWLYKNNNKMTMVYDEKLVRLMIQKLQRRVAELETDKALAEESLQDHLTKS